MAGSVARKQFQGVKKQGWRIRNGGGMRVEMKGKIESGPRNERVRNIREHQTAAACWEKRRRDVGNRLGITANPAAAFSGEDPFRSAEVFGMEIIAKALTRPNAIRCILVRRRESTTGFPDERGESEDKQDCKPGWDSVLRGNYQRDRAHRQCVCSDRRRVIACQWSSCSGLSIHGSMPGYAAIRLGRDRY